MKQCTEEIFLKWVQEASDIGLAFNTLCGATEDYSRESVVRVADALQEKNVIYYCSGDEESQDGYCLRRSRSES